MKAAGVTKYVGMGSGAMMMPGEKRGWFQRTVHPLLSVLVLFGVDFLEQNEWERDSLLMGTNGADGITWVLTRPVRPTRTPFVGACVHKDRRGPTVRRAIYMAKSWIEENGDAVEGLSFHLAGVTVGFTAAINEAVFETNRLVIPLVLVFIFFFVMLFYRSFHAGWLMFLAMSFATVLSYAYMGARGIGLNINTVLMIAVGIGVGIDYSIYIMDRIREEMTHVDDLSQAIARAIGTTGLAVCVTAGALVLGVILWVFMSDLKFQAEAAMMLIVMLALNFVAALFIVPAWITLFRPKFILNGKKGE